jgi:predicted lipoprotein with Yx(FWY)xxD motif
MKALFAISVLMLLLAGCAQQAPPASNTSNTTDVHGCSAGTQWCGSSQKCISSSENCPVPCPADAKICPDGSSVGRVGPNCDFAPCPQANNTVANNTTMSGPMSQADALAKAQNSSCAQAGEISVIGTYNNNSDTWWFDITENKSGCNPACVVSSNGSAEVNWRCTGLIMYTVSTANTSLGQVLVDGNGFTLYTFASDSANKSACTGGCATNWPPLLLTSDTIKVPSSITGDFGAFARDANSLQVTYNGMPLYRYKGDSNPGDTNGDGIGGVWYAVKTVGQ